MVPFSAAKSVLHFSIFPLYQDFLRLSETEDQRTGVIHFFGSEEPAGLNFRPGGFEKPD